MVAGRSISLGPSTSVYDDNTLELFVGVRHHATEECTACGYPFLTRWRARCARVRKHMRKNGTLESWPKPRRPSSESQLYARPRNG